MPLKFGYDTQDEYNLSFRTTDEEAEGYINVEVDSYGVEIFVKRGVIARVRIRTYEFDVEIPTDDIRYHNAIRNLLMEMKQKTCKHNWTILYEESPSLGSRAVGRVCTLCQLQEHGDVEVTLKK